MNYFYATEVNEGYTCLYETESKIEVGDFVVIPNYEDEPVTAKVTELVNRYNALTAPRKPQAIIDVVRIKEWKEQREKAVDNQILLDSMEEKIKEIKMLETLEKYAGKDPKMLEMLQAFKGTATDDVNEVE